MGIVNLTPDSFYAGSRVQADVALSRIRTLLEEGADVVDLGACSTRPGAPQPSLEEEWGRLEPTLKEMAGSTLPGTCPPPDEYRGRGPLAGRSQSGRAGQWEGPEGAKRPEFPGRVLPAISIDTYRSEIVRRAYDFIGPFMVNDVGGGELDPMILRTVGELGLPYVAMCPSCASTEEVITWFREFSMKAQDNGIQEWILDPGFGFGKTVDQNYEVLEGLERIVSAFPQPVMAAVSRKSMIYKKLGIGPEEAMPATQVVQFVALQKGATWLRVHDVAPAVQTARLYSTMYTSSPGAAK